MGLIRRAGAPSAEASEIAEAVRETIVTQERKAA
jgi:hypothetical protein